MLLPTGDKFSEYHKAFGQLAPNVATTAQIGKIKFQPFGMATVLELHKAGYRITNPTHLKAFLSIMLNSDRTAQVALHNGAQALANSQCKPLPDLLDFLHLTVLTGKLNMTGFDTYFTCLNAFSKPKEYPIKSVIRFFTHKHAALKKAQKPSLSFTYHLLGVMKLPIAVDTALSHRFPPAIVMLCISYIHSDDDLAKDNTELHSKAEEEHGDVLTLRAI